jgi:hypothetical protein
MRAGVLAAPGGRYGPTLPAEGDEDDLMVCDGASGCAGTRWLRRGC